MKITLPELSLVVLIGASGSGKSTFARQHFRSTEILSSDYCRGLVSDDETDQSASRDAFDVLHYIAAKRLGAGRLTVVDATNVQTEDRKPLLDLARQYHCFPVAIVLNLPESLCHERNQQRADRQFGPHVVRRHSQNLRRSLHTLEREGFRYIYVLSSLEEIQAVEIERQPLWNNRQQEHGPFDIIGDVHGCCNELEELLQTLGYERLNLPVSSPVWEFPTYVHPAGRKAVFLGDLVDRGPRILDTLKLVHNMVVASTALCVPGNHDMKLLRKLNGRNVKVNHGLEQTLGELAAIPDPLQAETTREFKQFLDGLISHYVLDGGQLVVAHAGMKAELQGRGSRTVREFALYGETTGEIDQFGLPVRYNWAAEYRGRAIVVYGHTPVPAPEWLNNTVNIDTGCVFGGKLTALRYPEKEWVSIPARQVYCEPVKPLLPEPTPRLTAQQEHDELLNIADVLGKRIISTRLYRQITIREENAIVALEVMSRFAANPRWLIYLPPTMSPVATSSQANLLEHPVEAFSYYREQGITELICEEKHMGSRAIVVVCRDETAARRRFGVQNEGIGICYTRTGRRFFEDSGLETELLDRLNAALTQTGFWETFQTDWVCLDCELMPWSAKAQGLIRQQYAPVGIAARQALGQTVHYLEQVSQRGIDVNSLLTHAQQRDRLVNQYTTAYRNYCWSVNSIADLKLAPFHLLATEATLHTDKPHAWHLQQIAQFCQADPVLLATDYRLVDLNNPQTEQDAIAWWEDLTAKGGEGMVVKPLQFVPQNQKGLLQPAVKCRGPEYLRIIYGPEYSLPENVDRLRQRGLAAKRSLALREFALSIEALERFTAHAPLRQVHECVFAILALESEPVDPRL